MPRIATRRESRPGKTTRELSAPDTDTDEETPDRIRAAPTRLRGLSGRRPVSAEVLSPAQRHHPPSTPVPHATTCSPATHGSSPPKPSPGPIPNHRSMSAVASLMVWTSGPGGADSGAQPSQSPQPPMYPQLVLREAIANALTHRDYSPDALGTPVHVDVFTDRIEVSNLGGLLGAVSKQRLTQVSVRPPRATHCLLLAAAVHPVSGRRHRAARRRHRIPARRRRAKERGARTGAHQQFASIGSASPFPALWRPDGQASTPVAGAGPAPGCSAGR